MRVEQRKEGRLHLFQPPRADEMEWLALSSDLCI